MRDARTFTARRPGWGDFNVVVPTGDEAIGMIREGPFDMHYVTCVICKCTAMHERSPTDLHTPIAECRKYGIAG
jgi:hypothetical protein